MDCLPVETLQQIFKLACIDGGYTGCSLALTSRFVRRAAQSTRFHSITLKADAERLAALVTLYQGQCLNTSGSRPQTAHLHISFQKKVNPSQSNGPTEDEWDGSGDEEPSSPPRSSPVATRDITPQQLFALVAGDLESLVITKDLDFFVSDPSLFDLPFHSLRELTLVRHADPSRLISPGSPVLPLFPALTHLHLVAPERSRPLLAGWVAHAPRVTHLRISAYNRIHELLDELPDAVGSPAYPFKHGFRVGMTTGPRPAVRTYPTLTHVVVEPGRPPVKGVCGTGRMAFTRRNVELGWIAGQARDGGVEMYIPEPRERTKRELDEEIRVE